MRAELKSLELEPDPSTLAGAPAGFALTARMIVGPEGVLGEESFDVTVCTPEWLAGACRRAGGIYDARHHLVITDDNFDQRALSTWLSARVRNARGETWAELAHQLSRLGHWEFEDYRD